MNLHREDQFLFGSLKWHINCKFLIINYKCAPHFLWVCYENILFRSPLKQHTVWGGEWAVSHLASGRSAGCPQAAHRSQRWGLTRYHTCPWQLSRQLQRVALASGLPSHLVKTLLILDCNLKEPYSTLQDNPQTVTLICCVEDIWMQMLVVHWH